MKAPIIAIMAYLLVILIHLPAFAASTSHLSVENLLVNKEAEQISMMLKGRSTKYVWITIRQQDADGTYIERGARFDSERVTFRIPGFWKVKSWKGITPQPADLLGSRVTRITIKIWEITDTQAPKDNQLPDFMALVQADDAQASKE